MSMRGGAWVALALLAREGGCLQRQHGAVGRPTRRYQRGSSGTNIVTMAAVECVEDDEDLPWVFSETSAEVDEEDEVCTPGEAAFTEQHHAAAHYRVVWSRAPRSALVLAKRHADDLEVDAAELVCRAIAKEGVKLFLASPLFERIADRLPERPSHWAPPPSHDHAFVANTTDEQPDFVTTLGGDGLLLYANSLFQRAKPPPIVAFSGGSLGFLAPFDVAEFEKTISSLIRQKRWPVSLRMRLRCRVLDPHGVERSRHEVLNEAVVDRGSSPFLSAVEFYCNDVHLTTVQADGLIVATPTGSTAYSLAAGGPMLHPSAQGMVFTPICPHSLAFRPIVFADSAKLRCVVDPSARSDAWVTFDGRSRVRLDRGDSLLLEASPFPLPTILKAGNTADWFDGLHSSFNFNTRARQKPIIPPPLATSASSSPAVAASSRPPGDSEADGPPRD